MAIEVNVLVYFADNLCYWLKFHCSKILGYSSESN